MKTIKILLLILLAVLSMSCSEDNNVCSCQEVEARALPPYTNWVDTGRKLPTDFKCEDNGHTYYTQNPESNYRYRLTVTCN
jgi:hypothetical protein